MFPVTVYSFPKGNVKGVAFMTRAEFIKTITSCDWEPNSSEYYAYTKKYDETRYCDIICNADSSVTIATQAGIYSRRFSGIFTEYDKALSMLLIIQCELG